MEARADHILDLRAFINSFSLLKVRQAFRAMKNEDTIEILTEDIKIKNDIFRVLTDSRYKTILIEEDGSTCRILLRKT